MNYSNPPLDHAQMIAQLKQRNLIVSNDAQAIEQLKIISYFRLANYLRPMEQDKVTHAFKPNSTFDNAVDLYYFDKKLRALLFTAIQSFEIALRSKLIHHFSLAYGAFWIIDRTLFSDTKIFNESVLRIQQEVFRSKENFIQDHFSRYNAPTVPPAWKSLEVVSFGTLSRILCNLTDKSLKKKIAREFNLPQSSLLESWCKSAVALRNNLAHHSRTWNRIFPIKPQLPKTLNGKWINTSGVQNNRLYAQICSLAYIENAIHPGNDFKDQLKNLLTQHPNVDVAAMGFPKNWEQESLWL